MRPDVHPDLGGGGPDTVGLQTQEAKDLLAAAHHTVVEHQVAAALASAASCQDCGIPRRHKDSRPIVIGRCSAHSDSSAPVVVLPLPAAGGPRVQPVGGVLRGADHPGVGLTCRPVSPVWFLRACPPPAQRDPSFGSGAARHHGRQQVQATAQRLEDELGDERPNFHHRPADCAELPHPGPAAGRRTGRRLRPLLHPTDPPRPLVRGDRRQDRALRRAVIVFRVRSNPRQQTPDSTRWPSICWTASTSRCG